MNKRLHPNEFKQIFLHDTPLIDVRAPVEFHQGSLPGAVNFPILNDDERALIGLTYKKKGQEEAVRLGYQLISGATKESRVGQWSKFIHENPNTVVYCFRGGKRSQITQQWLSENKIDRPIIEGGYKAVRTFLLEQLQHFCLNHIFTIVSGPTGSGKTDLLKELGDGLPVVDLEGLARHRGSAFGSMGTAQPSQIDFENNLAVRMLKMDAKFAEKTSVVLEDESRLIGSRSLPEVLFQKIREAPLVWIEEPFEVRVNNIFKDYILNGPIGFAVGGAPRCAEEESILQAEALKVFTRYRNSMVAIQRKLGGLRTQEVLADLAAAEARFLSSGDLESNKIWIEKLLQWYYDPMYLSSLEKRQAKVLFKGSYKDAKSFIEMKKP